MVAQSVMSRSLVVLSHHDGTPTSPSNERFDQSLRARDSGMGIRDDRAVAALADEHGIADEAMPANNRILIWRRR